MANDTLVERGIPTLSGNVLKILAAFTMAIDHAGLFLFPKLQVMRYIGRLAFPIFAFMIAEGCAHTRNRLRYFLSVLALAAVCQAGFAVVSSRVYLFVPVTFSIAIVLVYILQAWKKALFGSGLWAKILWGGLFFAAAAALWVLDSHVELDYGFWGCMMTVGASLFRRVENTPERLAKLDRHELHVLMLGLFLLPLVLEMGAWQSPSLLALPLLGFYSGRRGKYKMKYFFYIFYPAHLVVIFVLRAIL